MTNRFMNVVSSLSMVVAVAASLVCTTMAVAAETGKDCSTRLGCSGKGARSCLNCCLDCGSAVQERCQDTCPNVSPVDPEV